MCGIAGYVVGAPGRAGALRLFQRLLRECQARGRHASGVSWAAEGRLEAIRVPQAAEGLLGSPQWVRLHSSPPGALIGHTRYSTSGDWHDNTNTQPIVVGRMSVAHNGLVSMASKDVFQKAYRLRTRTANDTELILRALQRRKGDYAAAFVDLYRVHPPIFSCAFLDADGTLTVVRDHIRPLWLFNIPELQLTGFASTKDIVERAMHKQGFKYSLEETLPYNVYRLTAVGSHAISSLPHTPSGYAGKPEPRYKRPPIVHKMLSKTRPASPATLDCQKLKMRDHRSQLRRSFKQYCVAAIASWEIDPNYALMNYLFRRYELSRSQEYWACFLYGTFYHPGSVFYVMQEFPEFEKVDLERLKLWHAANWRKLCYNTDRKYEKGHFVEMFESYRDLMGGQQPNAQAKFFDRLLTGKPTENFHNVTKELSKLWHFGRYSVYIYTECLHRCMGLPMKADTIFLKEADSPRAGLCRVLGKEEWAKGPLGKEQWLWLEKEADKLMREIQQEYPDLGMDHWFMESCLCAYKGFFRPTKGRYLGYYLDRMIGEIRQMQEAEITSGIDWNVLYQFRKECIIPEYLGELADPPRLKIDKKLEHTLRDTGRMVGLWPITERGLL